MIILVDLDILISQVFTPLHPGHGAGGGEFLRLETITETDQTHWRPVEMLDTLAPGEGGGGGHHACIMWVH